ncbi:MAG TPA: glycosyltransferase family 4 protein [Paucimonas sp.]|nr:glycosyltransferase family 4 protein [Paucimonas sp.]
MYYEAEGYVTSGEKLMGRQAAGEGFLRAAARSGAARLACHAVDLKSAQHFGTQLKRHGFGGQVGWIPTADPAALQMEGTLYMPGPELTEFAWRRAPSGDRLYSLCGITHTTASHIAMTAIVDLLTAPVRSWDALICTSTSVRDTVRFLLERQADYLRMRLGACRFELPQLPMIPLGVHCDDYAFSADERTKARQAMDIAEDEVVVLFVGRLSFHAKAHPLQMYTALERAARGRKVRLVQCGWFANAPIEAAFKDGASILCPSVATDYVDGRDVQARRKAWAAADIFFSLSDNIQETFGLTPIEAMAAGLPVIVTDWDGYKDTVRDGVDGFRIPTVMPPAPLGEEFARRHERGQDNYDIYCGYTSQLVAVDPQALENACLRLIEDPALRRRMGDTGRQRARQDYDWSVIYGRYQALWDDLAERRRADPELHPSSRIASRPDRPDPFAAFAGYPTSVLSDRHLVMPLAGCDLAVRRNLGMNNFATSIHLNETECATILSLLTERSPRTVQEIVSAFPAAQRQSIARGLAWMAKMEAIHIVPPKPDSAAA